MCACEYVCLCVYVCMGVLMNDGSAFVKGEWNVYEDPDTGLPVKLQMPKLLPVVIPANF